MRNSKIWLAWSIMTFSSVVSAQAALPYDVMVFELNDGTMEVIDVNNLVMTFNSDNMKVQSDEKSILLPVGELKSLYFTNSSGIDDLNVALDGVVEVFALSGVKVGDFDSISEARTSLHRGVYIFKDNSGKTAKVGI